MFRAEEICEKVDFSWLEGKRILITGATGLIGSHLMACLRYLLDEGMSFFVHGQTRSVLSPFMHKLTNHHNIIMFQRDFTGGTMSGMLQCDAIIHAAGYAQPQRFMANTIATMQIGAGTTLELFRFLRDDGKFLFLSSCAVYDGLDKFACHENDMGHVSLDHPRIAYIEAKRAGEVICRLFRQIGVNAKAARLGVIYGPGARRGDTRALNSFVRSALCEQEIVLLDDGSAVHTYCYVSDAIELLWQILLHGRKGVYNVSGHSTISIANLARKVAGLIGSTRVIVPEVPLGGVPGAASRIYLDMIRAETEFGKAEYVGLDEGLQDTLDWYMELMVNV